MSMLVSEEKQPYLPKRGTLEGWKQAANMLFAPGCEGQSIALLASFASPLLAMTRMQGDGGALVSLWGKAFSGKTVACDAAMSVWGMTHQRIPLEILGTLPRIDSKIINADIGRTLEFLADAIVLKSKTVKPWKGIVVTFSPMPFMAFIELPHTAPLGIEFEIAVPKPLRQGKAAKRGPLAYELEANGGHAGRIFMEHFEDEANRTWARRQISSVIAELRETYDIDDEKWMQERFKLRAIGAIHAAGLAATELGLLDFDPERIKAFMIGKVYGERNAGAKIP